MSDDFTRATWRASKKRRLRKRTKPWGGRKTAPPAFLEAAKLNQFKPGRPGHRVCSATQRNGSPCTRLALKGMNVCEAHGGCGLLAMQGKLQPTGRAKARIAAQSPASKDQAPPPIDLIKLPLYRQANDWTRIRLARAFNTPAWVSLIQQIAHSQK
jgi:hypothetical protein